MSTKIYNGCLINVSTLKEYQDFITEMREHLHPIILNTVALQAVSRAVALIDHLAINAEDMRENTDRHFIWSGMQEYITEFDTNKESISMSHECSAVFFMLEDKVLAIPYMENPNAFIFHDKVDFYGYWNNTDQDEDCTDEEWVQRRDDWDAALTGAGVPVECGSVVEFSSPDYKYLTPFICGESEFKSMVEENLKGLERRFEGRVKREFFDAKQAELMETSGDTRGTWSDTFSKWMSEFKDEYVGSDEYNERCEHFKSILPELTLDLLYSKEL